MRSSVIKTQTILKCYPGGSVQKKVNFWWCIEGVSRFVRAVKSLQYYR